MTGKNIGNMGRRKTLNQRPYQTREYPACDARGCGVSGSGQVAIDALKSCLVMLLLLLGGCCSLCEFQQVIKEMNRCEQCHGGTYAR